MSAARSVFERMRTIRCPRPASVEHDCQIVEIFLHACHEGRFAKNPGWLPQYRPNVEAVASDDAGKTIAIEHTRIYAFEGHKKQEELLRPVAELLEEAPQLSIPGLRFHLRFGVPFLGNRLLGQQERVARELLTWAASALPPLEPRDRQYSFEVPIQLKEAKVAKVNVDVEVWKRPEGLRPVLVSGYLPPGERLLPLLQKALADKLPKLARAEACRRALILELPTTDSEDLVIKTICTLAPDYPLIDCVDEIVLAKTLALESEGVGFFFTWDMCKRAWIEYLEVILEKTPN